MTELGEPLRLDVVCRHCKRVMAEVTWHPRLNEAILVRAVIMERRPARDDRSGVFPQSGKGHRFAARWWHADGSDLSTPHPRRYGYDCRGKHRNTTGVVTVQRLTELYLDAAPRGAREIAL